ncbi:MAG: integrase [Mycobacterium sp.]|nr:integrase [Mycobacterium sp.]
MNIRALPPRVNRRPGSTAPGRLPDELLNSRQFDSLLEARVVVEDWRCDDNANRPHSVHGELTQPNSPYSGPRPTNPKPHSDWTTNGRPDTAGAVIDVHRVSQEEQSPVFITPDEGIGK